MKNAVLMLSLYICIGLGCSEQTTPSPAEHPFVPVDASLTEPDLEPPRDPLDAATPDLDLRPMDAMTHSNSQLCSPCEVNEDCQQGAQCLTNQTTGERFCGQPCSTEGDCPRGTTCYELSEEDSQCVPFSGSCAAFPPTDFGGNCTDDDDCQNGATHCERVGDRGYCTKACAEDEACQPGFSRCVDNRCQADWVQGPEGCGRLEHPAIPNCTEDEACPDDLTCLSTLLPGYPERIGGLCGMPCMMQSECPEDSTCERVGQAGQFCLPSQCNCLGAPIEESTFDQALASTQIHRCDLGITTEALHRFEWSLAYDAFRMPIFNRLYVDAYEGYRWSRQWRTKIGDYKMNHRIGALLNVCAEPLGLDALAIETPPETDEEFNEVVSKFYEQANESFRVNETPFTQFGQLPTALKTAIIRILNLQLEVIITRAQLDAESGLPPSFFELMYNHVQSTLITQPDFMGLNLPNRDLNRLAKGAYDYARIIQNGSTLTDYIQSVDWAEFESIDVLDISIETPFGPIIIAGNTDHIHRGEQSPLFLLDTGGADVYRLPVGATSSAQHPVSVAIDLAGHDTYGFPGSTEVGLYPPLAAADTAGRYDGQHPQIGDAIGPMSLSTVARQGAGILGVGVLYDRLGNDRYLSHKLSQGAGIFGMGLLLDENGDDVYVCEQGCQGAGSFGLGVLVDESGNDQYVTVQHAQGFGYIKGLGLLLDGDGDDHYEAILGDPEFGGVVMIYPSAQNANSNASFAQGAGFGRRVADSSGVFASGGFGALVDEGTGTDVYRADIFAQATAYWFGIGLLADGGGPDIYQGRWYTQGSTAHYALSYFFEEGGDDLYNPEQVVMATAVGQGHDLSHGWLVDYSGHDEYYAPGLGMGGGNDNGLGFFVDIEGDDIYHGPDGTSFGGGRIGERGAAFDSTLSFGLFIDGNGVDTYTLSDSNPLIGNDREWVWSTRQQTRKLGEMGIGVDVTGGRVLLP